MADFGGIDPVQGRWYFFLSAHGGGIVPVGDVIQELRAALHAGFYSRTAVGLWQFFALGFFGNDVGIDRETIVYQGGAGVRWHY